MTLGEKRLYLINRYGGSESWRIKVMRMPDNQIIAFYHSVIARDTRDNKPIPEETPQQLTIYDILNSKEHENEKHK